MKGPTLNITQKCSAKMNRRTDQRDTEELTESMKRLVLDNCRASNMYAFIWAEEHEASPQVLLNRMLSTKAYLSTPSAQAEIAQRAVDDKRTYRFLVSIGEGQCGIIFPLKGTPEVIKIAKSPEKVQQLRQDAIVHHRVQEAFRKIPSSLRQDINVPDYYGFVAPESNTFWDTFARCFPAYIKVPYYGLLSERIFPLPLPVRTAIVDALCSKSIRKQKEAFLEQPENKDCLVRLYLGRRNDTSKSEKVRLRNFPLHVNGMEDLKLNTEMYAVTMARALAVMHWTAGVDANDVEFVLGGSPSNNMTGHPTAEELEACDTHSAAKLYHYDYDHRSLSIWLLEFNQCKEFEHNSQGLKQLVDGFWWTDPYYPRPGGNKNDQNLWNVFRKAYLETSNELSGGTMAKDFIDAVEKTGAKRSGGLFSF
ncbi:hypothetical protein E4T50_15466 [Aureobasidium sp. EXF-12298]|nr:hypothetical protein E4T50_15466 [Aureobasidium sp. EXF-12298]